MEIYQLTPVGKQLYRNVRNPNTPTYGIIKFLAQNGAATKEQIEGYVPGADGTLLGTLKRKGVITGG